MGTTPTGRLDEARPGSPAQRERRRRILTAARELASAGGFEQMQMRTVAERADVALGTLYRYFPSKVHLLVSVLAQEFATTRERLARSAVTGEAPADRVIHVMTGITGSLQRDPHLTEALTRAFMFADASVAEESRTVARHVVAMLTDAMAGTAEPTDRQLAVAKVIADVWLANLVQWVTGRTSANDVQRSLDVAVRLLLRP